MRIQEAIGRFISMAEGGEDTEEARHTIGASAGEASDADLDEAVKMLIAKIRPVDAHSGDLAMVAGALVERGADPTPLSKAMLLFLPPLLERATRFAALVSGSALSEEDSESVEEEEGGVWLEARYAPAAVVEELALQNPEPSLAWDVLTNFCCPAIATWSRDPESRRVAAKTIAVDERLADCHGMSGWLARLLKAPDNEPFIVLHPGEKKGFRLRVSGVSDNFQLHTLLVDALVREGGQAQGWFGSKRVRLSGAPYDRDIVSVARGNGPQQIGRSTTGLWDLYQWTAVKADGELSRPVPSDDWIWGEGVPSDIAPFEGQRVVILGRPSYSRSWGSSRGFEALEASITVDEVLTPAEIREWMKRFGEAKR